MTHGSDRPLKPSPNVPPRSARTRRTQGVNGFEVSHLLTAAVCLALLVVGCVEPEYTQGDPPEQPTQTSIGERCTSDKQCDADAFCYFGDEETKGSSGRGICVTACDGKCGNTTPASRCIATADDGDICMPSCTVGEPDLDKCGGFSDVVCEVISTTSSDGKHAVCHPFCTTDSDCKSDHFCDRSMGLCLTEPTDGLAFGASCAPGSAECQGECIAVGEESLCTHRCVLGSIENCGDEEHDGVCFLADTDESVGDVGFCSELCNTDSDCSADGFSCEHFEDSSIDDAFGFRGVCNIAG